MLRKRWRLTLGFLAIALAVAATFVTLATPTYEASAQLFVSANDTGGLASGLQQGAQFSQDRVQSYADIIDSPHITDPVAARLKIGLTGKEISKKVSADAPLNTVLVNVHVRDTSPARAQLIANAVSSEFAAYAGNLEAATDNATSPVKVTVVKDAELPTSPVSPKVSLDLGLGLLVGLILGGGAAVLRETLDSSVKTTEDVQDATGRTTIGVIAFDPSAKDHPLVVIEDLHGTRAEAFRQLRTNLQFVDVDTPLRSIVCTSSVPGEGKTTTICNLAITLAHTGMRVLLMEADLRRPRVGMYMGIDATVGLTSVLIGAVGFEDAVQRWGPGALLDILPSGPTPPNPSELLGSRGMADLLRSLELKYDVVLLDAPPLLPVTDAAVLAVETSGAVLVVHHGKTRLEQLENSAQALSAVGARILGTVINFAPHKGPEAHYYGYAYSYRNADATGTTRGRRPRVGAVAAAGVSPRSRPSAGGTAFTGPAAMWSDVSMRSREEAPSPPPSAGTTQLTPSGTTNDSGGYERATHNPNGQSIAENADSRSTAGPTPEPNEPSENPSLRPYFTDTTSTAERTHPGGDF